MSLRDERGELSLVGLLVTVALALVVLSATGSVFITQTRQVSDLDGRTAAQDLARSGGDRIARQLRNLASPTPAQPQAIDQAGAFDLVFKTVDPTTPSAGTANPVNVKRVRYCLDGAGRLQGQEQTWTSATVPAVPSTSSCPSAAWPRTSVVATGIVNRSVAGTPPVCTYDAATTTAISEIHVDLRVLGGSNRPQRVDTSTGVFLRNQNRAPSAAFAASVTAQGIVLNGSASADPEGDPLTYTWFDGATQVATGITATLPLAIPARARTLKLVVADGAGLSATSAPQVVQG